MTTTKFEMGRWGLKSDPRGAHVTMLYRGRTLLGEVVGVERAENRGMTLLVVRHFNGEEWPLRPHVLAVDVLERDRESDDYETEKANADYERYLQQRGIAAEEHEREIGEWLDAQD